MSNNRLSFCTFTPQSDNVTEVKFDEDILVDIDMVDQYHHWLNTHHNSDFGVLIDKTDHYSYTFEAQLKIGRIDKMKAASFLVKDHSAELAIESLMGIKQRRKIDYEIFYDHTLALAWLENKLSH